MSSSDSSAAESKLNKVVNILLFILAGLVLLSVILGTCVRHEAKVKTYGKKMRNMLRKDSSNGKTDENKEHGLSPLHSPLQPPPPVIPLQPYQPPSSQNGQVARGLNTREAYYSMPSHAATFHQNTLQPQHQRQSQLAQHHHQPQFHYHHHHQQQQLYPQNVIV